MPGQGGPLRSFPPPLPIDPWAALLASLPQPGAPMLPQLPTIGPASRPQAQVQPPTIGPAPAPTAVENWTDPQQLTQALQDLTRGLWSYGTHPVESFGKAAQGGAQAAQGLWELPVRAPEIAQGLGQVGAGGFVQGMGDYLGERFGSPTQAVQTALTDPVGALLDAPVDPVAPGMLGAAALIAKPGRQVMKAGSEAGRLGVGARRVYPGLPGFYSKTVEAAGLLPEQIDVAGVIGALRGLGATDKNIEFLKIPELLAGRTGKIARDEVVQHLEQNLPRIAFHPRGGKAAVSSKLKNALEYRYPNRDITTLTQDELLESQRYVESLAQHWQRNGDQRMAEGFFRQAEEIGELLEGTKNVTDRPALYGPTGNYKRYAQLNEQDTLRDAANYTENPMVVKPAVEPSAVKVKPEERWEDRIRIAQSRLRGHGIAMRMDLDASGRVVNPDAPVLIFADTNNPNRTMSWGDVIERIDDETADYVLDAMKGESEYKQKFVTEPAREPYRGGHMREDDVMAWTRTQDRPLSNASTPGQPSELGRSIEEYQSDLHHDAFMRYQDAVKRATEAYPPGSAEFEAAKKAVPRDVGYDVGNTYAQRKSEAWDAYEQAEAARSALVDKYKMSWTDVQRYHNEAPLNAPGRFGMKRPDGRPRTQVEEGFLIGQEYAAADNAVQVAREQFERLSNNPPVWDAPMKQDWNKALLKQQLWDVANDPDLSWIGHTTGDTQNWRYDLAEQVSRLTYDPATQELVGYKRGGQQVRHTVAPEELPAYVGGEVAEKLKASGGQLALPDPDEVGSAMAAEPTAQMRRPGLWELRGKELSVGGQGKKSLYDVRFVKDANEVLKPFGAGPMELRDVKAGDVDIKEWVAKLSPEVKQTIRERGLDLFAIAPILMALDAWRGGQQ